MEKTRLLIEIGTGVELHGQEVTKAASKAIRDAMSKVCFGMGLAETFRLGGHGDAHLEVLIGCPRHEQVNREEVLKAIPYGHKELKIVEGGMIARGHFDAGSGDKSDDIIIANAAITVYVEPEKFMKMCQLAEEK